MQNQQLFEVPFASEIVINTCVKDIGRGRGKCMCEHCRSQPNDEAQWLFESPIEPPANGQSWLFESVVSPEADYMAGKRRKGKEHTSLAGGSKTRLRPKHEKGKSRKSREEAAADRRAEGTTRSAKEHKRLRALTLTGLEQPTEAQVVALVQAKELEQESLRQTLSIARQRRNLEEVRQLESKYWQLENLIKKLKQFRLEIR